jgi:hypothetical protein
MVFDRSADHCTAEFVAVSIEPRQHNLVEPRVIGSWIPLQKTNEKQSSLFNTVNTGEVPVRYLIIAPRRRAAWWRLPTWVRCLVVTMALR